jgi:DNA mismatch repair protein MutS
MKQEELEQEELVQESSAQEAKFAGATPLMMQYHEIKAQYPEALLLFQVGDFYELFFNDAKQAAACLGIALTARGKSDGEPIPLCGVPLHTKDHHIAKLVKGGFKVAICDQLELPRPGTIVKRGVTQVLTPGTLTDSQLLDAKSASYLFAFFPVQDKWGLLFGEILTAQLFATVIQAGDNRMLESELSRFLPDEVLVPNSKLAQPLHPVFKRAGYNTTSVDFSAQQSEQLFDMDQWMGKQFTQEQVQNINSQEAMRLALYYFYAYVRKNQPSALDQFKTMHIYQPEDFLVLDVATQRNLELVKNNSGDTKNTLFSVVDGAATAMGSRMIKKWLLRPLVKQKAIEQRLDVVALFMQDIVLTQQLVDALASIGDIERVIGRVALHRAPQQDYLMLIQALEAIPALRALIQDYTDQHVLLAIIHEHIGDFSQLHTLLCAALNSDSSKDWIIKQGFDAHLDQLRELVFESNQKILELEAHEQQVSGINSLKIRYNQVHGYYIEITKTNAHLVPSHYIRQQTLVGRERYTTPALQELQHEIMRARTDIAQVEKAVFDRVKMEVGRFVHALRKLAHALAHLDALLGFAQVAYESRYTRPDFNNKRTFIIEDGRHPVVEQVSSAVFIPNNTRLDDEQCLWIITGPNMGGKSTYLRQVALIQILAQCGSFVPAQRVSLPLIDRLFTRIGAGDNVAGGKSTFLVEMEETATICSQATENSLVILDEVGRGTSTFDGLAIAQAVVEYLYHEVKARCMFATHYHELTALESALPGVVSYHAASRKTKDGIVFLYKMVCGVADGSFGVEVAKLAALPPTVISRAHELLAVLTAKQGYGDGREIGQEGGLGSELELVRVREENRQLRVLLDRQKILEKIDYDQLSPKKAFDILWILKEQ